MTNIDEVLTRMGASVGKNKKALIAESQIHRASLWCNPRLNDLMEICQLTQSQLIVKIRSGVEIPIEKMTRCSTVAPF